MGEPRGDAAPSFLKWLCFVIASYWSALPDLTQLLVFLMFVDVIFGIAVSFKQKDISAHELWRGITNKILTLLLVGVAGMIDPFLPPNLGVNLAQAASAFYVVAELGSIIRNAAVLNIPVFNQLTGVLRVFQAASGDKDETTTPAKPGRDSDGDQG